ncbi:uncharacterized protein LOC144910354 [Branchiostoma floridae x Branchiostoma belcheri]
MGQTVRLKCGCCDYRCFLPERLKKHWRKYHRPVLTCEICSYKCLQPKTMRKHLKTHPDLKKKMSSTALAAWQTYTEPIFTCELCKHQCKSYDLLLKHMKQHNRKYKGYCPDGIRSVLCCDSCDYECVNPKTMRRHIKNHTNRQSNNTPSSGDHENIDSQSSQKSTKKHADGIIVDDNPGSTESFKSSSCLSIYNKDHTMDYEEEEHRTQPGLASVEFESQTNKAKTCSGTEVVSRDNMPYCTIYWSYGGCSSSNTGHLVELHVGNNVVTSDDLL